MINYDFLAGFIFGIMGSKTKLLGRPTIVALGTLIHLVVFIGIFINFPKDASLGKTDKVGIIHPRLGGFSILAILASPLLSSAASSSVLGMHVGILRSSLF